MLLVNDLKIQFENEVITKNLTFQASTGDIIFLVGKNGAGKTSVLKTIAGIFQNSSVKKRTLTASIYFNSQMELHPGLTGNDIFDLYEVCNSPWFDMDILKIFEVQHKLAVPLEKLSAGEKQRILLAATLFYNTDCILLDEPLTYLDMSFHFLFKKIIERFSNLGRTFLISNHDFSFCYQFKNSKILFLESPESFIFDSTTKVLNDKRLQSLFNICVSEISQDGQSYLIIKPGNLV